MATTATPPVLIVVQLTGGNDFLNTVIPYTNPIYYDSRTKVVIPEEEVLPLDDSLGFHPSTAPLKELYDAGHVARIVQGVGYPNSNRSHFRGMDIWHTCQSEVLASEGWLGRAIQELDPRKENVLTGVSFGRGLPRAMTAFGVPVATVGDLDSYGLLTGIEADDQRATALATFKQMYAPAIGTGPVMDYLAQTGQDVLRGEARLKEAPARYSSTVEYADNPIAKSLRDVARVHLAGLGARVFYAEHGGYDHHANEMRAHPTLLADLTRAIMDFFQDIRDHGASDEVVMLVFTEFGRRMRDNGSGTDHGSGGGAFIIGDSVRGGLYAEYPPLDPAQWEHGEDLKHTIDYRGVYGTLLEQWMGIDAAGIVGGSFEQIRPFKQSVGAYPVSVGECRGGVAPSAGRLRVSLKHDTARAGGWDKSVDFSPQCKWAPTPVILRTLADHGSAGG